jgi:hypothetical protein
MATKTKAAQKKRVVAFKDFNLKQFKVTKIGVDVTHEENGTESGTITKIGKYLPHPDLRTAMDKLQLYMATRLGLLTGWDYASEHIKGVGSAKKGAMEGHKQAVSMCNIGGLTFKGEGDTYGVAITGSLKTPISGSVGMSVPKISFEKMELGYEDDVKDLCDEIKKEIYAYRFQHKKFQTDIVSEAEKAENPELFGDAKSGSEKKK